MTKNEMVSLMLDFNVAFWGSKPEQYTDHSKELLSMPREDVQKWFEESKRVLLQKTEENREEIKRLYWVLEQKELDIRAREDALLNGRVIGHDPEPTNETTELESGAPKLPGSDIEPRISPEAMALCDSLGIKPQHRFWEHLVVHELGQESKEEYLISFLGSYYQPNKEECQLFLGKLREIALSRRSRRWTARFDKSCLRIREI